MPCNARRVSQVSPTPLTMALRRSARLKRLATAGVILGQLLTAAPLFAQDIAQATVRASSRAAADLQRKSRSSVSR